MLKGPERAEWLRDNALMQALRDRWIWRSHAEGRGTAIAISPEAAAKKQAECEAEIVRLAGEIVRDAKARAKGRIDLTG